MPYVDVILPLALDRLYTYSVSGEEAGILRPGMRIAVPFKRSKLYTALVHSLHEEAPQGYEARPIDQVLDEAPLVNEDHLAFWQWIASYYMCTLGDVMRTALPGAFMLQSETVILPAAKEVVDEQALSDNQFQIFEALQNNNALKVADIQRILERKTVLPVLQTMMDDGVIQMQERIQERYRPKWTKYIRVNPDYQTDNGLAAILEQLSRAEKQKALLMHYFQLAGQSNEWVKSTELLKSSGISAAVRKALVDKEILEEKKVREDRANLELQVEPASEINLNQQQVMALEATEQQLYSGQVVLLHGVTASGKTEIYVKLAQKALERGEQVLYMVPEIALTAQLITRLQKHFGESIMVYHSRYSVHERVETWNNVLQESPKTRVILGTRSSLFLPFQKLGLIIVDEEHDPSYKQFDPAPRYHGRDAAVVLAKALQSQIVLGSATPSVTSFNNHISGKYGYAQIPDRYKEILMPAVHLIDLREQHRKKIMKGHFSAPLLEAIGETLASEEQVILFQNRRGFSPIVECKTCGHIPQCQNCDVSLTYHQYRRELRCHYCGYHETLEVGCAACGNQSLDTKGLGTEQVESELGTLLPDARVMRMDYDTTRGKHSYSKIITAFEKREIDILVGTQMVTKGLDFRHVNLVGIMNADTLLNFPDYRAHERGFQLLMQVAGRAGRTKKQGQVIIQTYQPAHPVLGQVLHGDYEAMFNRQMEERKQFRYPPVYRIIRIEFKHKEYQRVQEGSSWFARALRQDFSNHVLGPESPLISRLRNQYIKQLLIKIPQELSLAQTKNSIKRIERSFNAISLYRSIRVIYHADHI